MENPEKSAGKRKDQDKLAEARSAEHPLTVVCSVQPSETIAEGGVVTLRAEPSITDVTYVYKWDIYDPNGVPLLSSDAAEVHWDTKGLPAGSYKAHITITDEQGATASNDANLTVTARSLARSESVTAQALAARESVPVTLQRAAIEPTTDQALWVVIRNRTNAISFNRYKQFIDAVMCFERFSDEKEAERKELEIRLPFPFVDPYNRLKVATELFLMQECGVLVRNNGLFNPDDEAIDEAIRLGRTITFGQIEELRRAYLEDLEHEQHVLLPYFTLIRQKLSDVPLKSPQEVPPNCYGILRSKFTGPCLLELIWSYWHEEGMLVQSMNAISWRFQNMRGLIDRDPLTRLDIDPLRPLNNLLWGYIQDEQHLLTLRRRAYEYDHHYGLTLYGKAVPTLRSVDSRSKFLEAFHNLLYLCSIFYKEDDDTTVIADAFRVLHALREVHLLLAEGAHNQFGDLPSTARMEMLMQQWLLSRPEFREFLGGRVMVPYAEPWMDRVDTMKGLQGWTDVTVTHFRDLGVFGEQILLSIRYGNWSQVILPAQAANWARYWRPEIQGYIHAYRAVTGVDLAADMTDTQQATERYLPPSVHLRKRLAQQQQALPLQRSLVAADGRARNRRG